MQEICRRVDREVFRIKRHKHRVRLIDSNAEWLLFECKDPFCDQYYQVTRDNLLWQGINISKKHA